jgi:hypothetical protein
MIERLGNYLPSKKTAAVLGGAGLAMSGLTIGNGIASVLNYHSANVAKDDYHRGYYYGAYKEERTLATISGIVTFALSGTAVLTDVVRRREEDGGTTRLPQQPQGLPES